MASHRFEALGLPHALAIDTRLCSSGVTVTVRGEVDVHTAPHLRDRLAEMVRQGEEHLAVLLDEVTFMDSTGLGVLVGAHAAQRAGGGTLEIVCGEPRMLRLLEITGLHRVFTVRGVPTTSS